MNERSQYKAIRNHTEFDQLPPGAVVVYDQDDMEMVVVKAPCGIVNGQFVENTWVDGGGGYYTRGQILAGMPRLWTGGDA